MMKNFFIAKSKIHGDGLFTKVPIKMGMECMVVFNLANEMNPLARKINHIDFPNAKSIIKNDTVVLVSKRDIESGEEITVDYTEWNETLPEPYHTMDFRKQLTNTI